MSKCNLFFTELLSIPTCADASYFPLFFDDDGVTLIGEEKIISKDKEDDEDIHLNLDDSSPDVDFKEILKKDNHLIGNN